MDNTYTECINLFAADSTVARVLIITAQDICSMHSVNDSSVNTDITIISTRHEIKLQQVLSQLITLKNPSIEENKKLYDLVILDRVSDAPVLDSAFHAIWHKRHQMLQSLSKMLTADGGIVILANNTTYIHNISHVFSAVINKITQTKLPGSFLSQYKKELRQAAFCQLDHYYVLPNFELLSNLVSSKRNAYIAFMMHLHGFSLGVPNRPKQWLLWLAVKLTIGFWFIPCQLLWARK